MDENTEARIEAIRVTMGTEYRDATKSDVLRAAIMVGLEVMEQERGAAAKRKPQRERRART